MFAPILPLMVFAAWAAALFAALGGLHAEPGRRRLLWIAATCLAPSAAAWVLSLGWRLFPGLSDTATLLWLAGSAAAVIAVASRRARFRFESVEIAHWRVSLSGVVLLCLLATIVYLVLRIPAYSNDPLEYAAVARLLDAHRSLSLYPVLDTTVSHGLYAPWTHPPGYPLLMALAIALAKIDAVSALKWVAALHVVLGLAGLFALLPKRLRWVAVLSLLATPAYAIGVINGYVEAVRITALIGVFAACLALWQAAAVSSAVRLGFLFALCGFVHSLGILSAAFFLPVLMLRRHGSIPARLAWCAGIVASQLIVLAPDLWRNITRFGVLLGDRPAIWQLPEIGRTEYFRAFRELERPLDVLIHGLLQGFSQVSNFGLTYWIPALSALGLLARARRAPAQGIAPGLRDGGPMIELALGIVVTFYALATALTLMGSVEAIKNARYVLTVQPFVAIVTGWLVLRLLRADSLRRMLCLGLGVCVLVPLAYMTERHPGLMTNGMDRLQAYFAYAKPEADAVREVDRRVHAGGCALLFQQADYALYGTGCFRSFLDHRFADVYRDASATSAALRLRSMGISLIVTPSHALPEIYNTAVGRMLADPTLTRLSWADGGFSIYALVQPGEAVPVLEPPIEIVPPASASGHGLLIDWARLARPIDMSRPATQQVGVLCVDVTGRGLVELTTLAPGATGNPTGIILKYMRGESNFVAGADVAGRRHLCVQQLSGQASGRLRVETSPGLHLDRLVYRHAAWPAPIAKEP